METPIDNLQIQQMPDNLSRKLWRKVVQDHCVNFELLLASFKPGYNLHDEGSAVGGMFLVNRTRKCEKPLSSQFDWELEQCFQAQSNGVFLVYPH